MATLQELLKASQQRDLAGASPSGTPTTSALSHYNPYGVTGVTDADGINGARLLGVDGPESAGMQNGAQGNHKAQLIRDKYGVSLEDQVRLGHRATESLIQQMQGNPQFTEAGTDVYGRPLIKNEGVTDKLLSTGLYAPTDRYDQKAQGLFRAAAEKRAQLGISENDGTMIDDIRDYNIGRQAPSAWKRLKNLPSGLASATQQLVAGTGDMLLDAIDPLGNNTLLDKSKSAEQANKTWGYKTAKEVEYQTDEAVHEWKKGNYGKAILHGINAAPDTIVGSIPTIASMFIGVGEANAAGRAIAYGASKTAHMAEGAEKIAMAAEFAKSYGGLTAVKGALKANAGFAAVVGNQTNNDIDAFIQNNNGQEPDLAQIARMTAINTVTASLDKNVFADVIGKPKLMDKYFKGISESMEIVPKSKIGAIAGQVLKTSAAMGEEAGQEYIQQWGQIINQQLGTPKGTTLEQIFASQENKDSVLGAAILGAGAGGGMHGIANAPKYAKEVISGPEKTQEQLVQEYASNLSAKDKSVLEAKYGSDLSAIDYYTKEHETIREQVKNAKSVEELEAIKYTTGADVSYINNALERHKATNAAINNMTPEEVRSAEVEIANINAMKENIKQFQAENTPKGMIDSMAASNDPTGHYTPDMQEAWGAKLGALKEAMGGMSENAQVLSAKASTSDDTDLQSMKDSIIGGLSSNLGDITTQKEALNERLKASQSVKARESKQEAVDTKAIEEIIPKSILGNIFSSGAKKGEEILKDYSTKSLNEALANTADKRTKALISRVLQKRQDAKANLGFSEKATESIGEKANLRTPTREVNATMVELGKLAMSNGTISKSAKAKAIKAITVLKAHGYNSKELQEFSKAISSRKVTETTTYAKEEKVGVKEGTETTKEKGTPRVLDEKEIREELKKRGATEEQADDLIAKIQSAGMSEVLTAKDLAVGLHFEQLHDKDLGVSPRKASRKKNKLHEARNVTDQDLLKIVQEGMSIEEMVEMSNREYPANYFKRVWKKLYKGDKTEPKGVYYLEELLDTITKELEENLKIKKIMSSLVSTEDITPAQVLRGVVIALANVQSQIVSEYDINVRNNLPIEKHQAAKLGLDTQIGKAFLNSFDLRLAGGNPLNIATKYKELGDKLLALTEELGLIEVSKGSVRLAINNQVTEKNDKVENGTSTLLVTNPKKGAATYMGKAISIVGMNDKLDERPLPGDRETSLRTAVSAMYKLMSPVNYELPTSEPVTEVPSDHNIKEKQKEIVQKLNKLKFFIKPKMLKFLEKIAEEANGDFDTYFSGNGAMNKFLDSDYNEAKFTKMNEDGRVVNKKGNFIRLLDNIEDLKGDLHFNYEIVVQERIHLMQTILDFQGDKFMARQLLSGEEYTTESQKEFDILVNDVASQLKVDIKEILNPTGKLASALKLLKEVEASGNILTVADINRISRDLGIKSGFQTLSLLNVVNDISNRKGFEVTSDYMVEADSSASGATNTLLNLSGLVEVQELLAKMDVFVNSTDTFDPYTLLNATIAEKAIHEDQTYVINTVKEFLFKGDDREMAKSPVMTWIYGQLDKNVALTMGDMITKDLITKAIRNGDKSIVSFINELLASDYNLQSIGDISLADKNILIERFTTDIGEVFSEKLNETFPAITKYRKKLSTIHAKLVEAGWEGEFQSPTATMLGETQKMNLKKEKAVIGGTVSDPVQANVAMLNETSMKVLPQQAVDAAELLLSIEETIDHFGDGKGIMTVHDAKYASPKKILYTTPLYNKVSKEIAIKYDFVDIALNELEETVNKMEAGKKKDSLLNFIKEKREENAPLMEAKAKYLEDKTLNIFGDKTINKEESVKEEANVKEETAKEIVRVETFKEKVQRAIEYTKEVGTTGIELLTSLVEEIEVGEDLNPLKEKVLASLKEGKIIFDFKGTEYKATVSEKENEVNIPKKLSDLSTDVRTGKNMTNEGFIETLAHEIYHTQTLAYITSEEGKNSAEVKYLQKVVEKLKTVKTVRKSVRDRIDSILRAEKTKGYGVVELSAVLENEPEVALAIQNLVAPRIIDIFKALIAKMKEYLNKLVSTEAGRTKLAEKLTSDKISLLRIQGALKLLEVNANIQVAQLKAGEIKSANMVTQSDPYQKEYSDPLNAINNMIAVQNRYISDFLILWGNTMEEVFTPVISTLHEAASKYPLYVSTISYIRTGFYESEFAQKMHQTLGIAGDSSKEVLDKAQGLFAAMNQETQKHHEAMAKFKRELNKIYDKKERVTLFHLTRTGLSHLLNDKELYSKITKGEISIEDAITFAKEGMDESTLKILDNIAEYTVTGRATDNTTNSSTTSDRTGKADLYIALKSMSMVKGGYEMFTKMDSKVRDHIMSIALTNKALNDVINNKGKDYNGKFLTKDAKFGNDYDFHLSKDIHGKVYEYKMITERDLKGSKYSSENEWVVIKEPTDTSLGVVARENLDAGNVTGVGLEINKYANGVFLNEKDSNDMEAKLESMKTDKDREVYLNANSLKKDGARFRVLLDTQTKIDKLTMITDASESLYRTMIHNMELISSQRIKDLLIDKGTLQINTKEELMDLNAKLKRNNEAGLRGQREEILPFVKVNFDTDRWDDMLKDPKLKYIAMYFKTPRNVSTYNDFSSNITLVKRGESDVLLGHKNFSLLGTSDNRDMARMEIMFKRAIILAKQKMIVTAPIKLMKDFASNMGVLSMNDMSPVDIYKGMTKGWDAYHEFSSARTEMVALKMETRIAHAKGDAKRVEYLNKKIATHWKAMQGMEFFDSYQAGFVQSYSTDLVTKEFDSISGIQQDIDNFVDKVTLDKDGNPNGVYKAIKAFQNFGGSKFNIDSLLAAAGKSATLNGTKVGDELIEMSERLKNKKGEESLARYISEMVGAPSSEIVSYGGAVMVLTDALSKYTLAKHLMTQENPRSGKRGQRKLYTKQEAYDRANESFIDYRYNVPSEIKALSDYGILMFPAFWMRIQKVIAGLVIYNPVSSLGGYAVEMALGIQSVNVLNEAIFMKEHILTNPTDIIGLESLILGV